MGHYTVLQVLFPWEFFVGMFSSICVNMAGNVDIHMPGIKTLWCYSCDSVCFQYCVLRTIKTASSYDVNKLLLSDFI